VELRSMTETERRQRLQTILVSCVSAANQITEALNYTDTSCRDAISHIYTSANDVACAAANLNRLTDLNL
jgi:hypothetical protein